MLENTDNNVSVTITKAAMQEAIDQLVIGSEETPTSKQITLQNCNT
jgi:hypothetical protein